MRPSVAVLADLHPADGASSYADIDLLVGELQNRGARVEVTLMPKIHYESFSEGWTSLFLGNLDFSAYDRVIGVDECALMVRYPGSVAWMSRMPFEGEVDAADRRRLRDARLRCIQSKLLSEFLKQGGHLWAGSGFLAGRLHALLHVPIETVPMVQWRMSDFTPQAEDGHVSQIPFLAVFDEPGPSTGLVEVVKALAQLGSRGPSLVVCSETLGGAALDQVRAIGRRLGRERFNVMTGAQALAVRQRLFDNALGVVTTTSHTLYPRCIFEAARSAKPVVVLAGNGGAAAELISDGLSGFTCFTADDIEAAVTALSTARGRAAALGERLRAEMRASVSDGPLSMSHTAERLLS